MRRMSIRIGVLAGAVAAIGCGGGLSAADEEMGTGGVHEAETEPSPSESSGSGGSTGSSDASDSSSSGGSTGSTGERHSVVVEDMTFSGWVGYSASATVDPMEPLVAGADDHDWYRVKIDFQDAHHRESGRIAHTGTVIAVAEDQVVLVPRIRVELNGLTDSEWARDKIRNGLGHLDAMLTRIAFQGEASGREIAVRIQPQIEVAAAGSEPAGDHDWRFRLYPGDGQPGGLADDTIVLYEESTKGVIAHESAHKAFAAADEYPPFRDPILHHGQLTLMSDTNRPLAPHSLTIFAQIVSAVIGEVVVPVDFP